MIAGIVYGGVTTGSRAGERGLLYWGRCGRHGWREERTSRDQGTSAPEAELSGRWVGVQRERGKQTASVLSSGSRGARGAPPAERVRAGSAWPGLRVPQPFDRGA